jgi:tetratricopeptide (TPR) repeat protein
VIRGHLGVALSIRDGPEAGLAQIEEALRMQPENAKLHAIAARVARDANRPRRAIEHYRAALDLGGRSVSHLNNLAWLLAVDPDAPESIRWEAVALAEEAAERSKSPRASVQDTLAIAYAAAGRWDEAVEAASGAVELAEKRGEQELAASIRERLIGYQGRRLP